jgi:tetratricopeptide (TPR) repeat protein
MMMGRGALQQNDYSTARRNFEEAYQIGKSPTALMYLAIIDYRTGNLDSAERLIREAEMMGIGNYHYLRVLGYKALILLNKDREQGLEALDRYVVLYSRNDPLMSINEVREMVVSGSIDIPLLNKLIEDQVSWYENDIQQYWSTGTGWYADKWGSIPPIPGPPECPQI